MRRAALVSALAAALAACGDEIPAGVDMEPNRPARPSDDVDPDPESVPCSSDAECAFGLSCKEGVCTASSDGPSDRGCRQDSDCPDGLVCAQSTGRCVPPAGASEIPPTTTTTCAPGDTRRCGSKIGACRYGVERCAEDSRWSGACEGGVTPTAERCNGADDDCDELTDEDFPTLRAPCTAGVGACVQRGMNVCARDGSGVVCDAVPTSTAGLAERCDNGEDDDCDGEVDEGFDALGDPCTIGIGACRREGTLICSTDELGLRCSASPGAPGAVELCGNGQDDDCDGQTDEGYATRMSCTVGVGACLRAGTTTCAPDRTSVVCAGTPGTPDTRGELCGNRQDDDCDGMTDEGFATGAPCTVGVGACARAATTTCAPDRTSVVCAGTPGTAGAELCGNNQDDDCDGQTDEGFPDLGAVCVAGVGACAQSGSVVCAPDGLSTRCGATPLDPTGRVELCGNGADDDCDGDTDEGFAVNTACSAGVGACARAGINVCSADRLTIRCNAVPAAPAPQELCGNATDDDCDGMTDEGFETLGASCTAGTGACMRTGTLLCTTDLLSLRCSATPGTPAPQELCGNAVDDDCDGQTDEGFPLLGTTCTIGAPPCQQRGTWICSTDRTGLSCDVPPAGVELCNGRDDDMDMCTDEDFDVGAPCSTGAGICARTGMRVCGPDQMRTECGVVAGPPNPLGELCGNGLDDDCDGATDEGFPDLGNACNVGLGICRRVGARICAMDRRSTVCDAVPGAPDPAGELCGNGLDDDCDGANDEGFADVGTACSVGQGICVRAGVRACSADRRSTICNATPGAPNAAGELCGNGLDDDCDGMTDEGFAGLGTTCTAGAGVCARSGTRVCSTDRLSTTCSASAGSPNPLGELCGNGLDDDCDGMTDEGFTDLGSACTAGTGACARAGTRVCSTDGRSTVCGATPGAPNPAGELCGNNADDDCDGMTDEGFTDLGNACSAGTGACARSGTRVCATDRLSTTCSATPGSPNPSGELCGNGADDDCDGATDEGYPDLGMVCTAGNGICRRNGARVCSADRLSTTCDATPGAPNPSGELCGNMLDDDCDGMTDEGFPGLGTSCSAGVGGCARTGSRVCSADRLSVVCSATAGTPGSEICGNGIDDDCDGMTDECVAPVVMCPAPIETRPLTAVPLMGVASDPDGSIAQWRWELVSAPPSASGTFSAPASQSTTFTPQLVGVYTVRLTVTDNSGLTASCTFTVTAKGDGIRVEISWNTNFSDVDAHLLRRAGGTAWFNTPNDCYYLNRTPSWDAPGTADDPRLDIDDVDGFGPENINVDAPVAGSTYRVGIHFYLDHLAGPTNVTVRIYCGDITVTPVAAYQGLLFGDSLFPELNDFWRVGDVRWNGNDSCTFTPINTISFGLEAQGTP